METDDVLTCVSCSRGVSDETETASNGDILCHECVRICERCETIGSVDDDFRVVDDTAIWCDSCSD